MGAVRYRASRSSSKKKSRSHISKRSRKKGLGKRLLIWAGSALLMAGVWFGYKWWKQQEKAKPELEAKGKPSLAMKTLTLFFSDEQAEFLVGEPRDVTDPGSSSGLAQAVLQELIRGPKGSLQPTIPEGTRVLAPVSCSQGTCTVDLSQEFVSRHPGGTSGEMMTVYSIVESLCANVPGVKRVQFLVEGKTRETLAGHLFIGAPVASEPGLLRREAS